MTNTVNNEMMTVNRNQNNAMLLSAMFSSNPEKATQVITQHHSNR